MLSLPTTCDRAAPRADGARRPGLLVVDADLPLDRLDALASTVTTLRALRSAGVGTALVPVAVAPDRGLDVPAAVSASWMVHGIEVLVAAHTSGVGTGPSATELVRAVQRGWGGSAGLGSILSCVVDAEGLLVGVEDALRNVGRAHRATGVPVLVRTVPRLTTGLDAAEILEQERVDPRRVLLTCCGDTTDDDHLAELAGWGYRLGFDRSQGSPVTSGERLDCVAELCRRGYGPSIALLHDRADPAQTAATLAQGLHERDVDDTDVHHLLAGTVGTWLRG